MNDPLLFIDSIIQKKEAESNQEFFDSRVNTIKSKAKYRLDDIAAMLYYRINVYAEVYTKKERLEGEVTNCNELGITLRLDKEKRLIPLVEIESINILKL